MKKSHIKRAFWYAFFLTFFLIAAHAIGMLQSVERLLTSLVTPLARVSFHSARNITDTLAGLHKNTADIKKENEKLRAELIGYTVLRARSDELIHENASLLNLLHYTASLPHTTLAQIVGAHTDASIESMIIDRGSEDGLHLNDPVITEQGVLIGVLRTIREHNAIVQLITDNQSQIAASVLNNDRTIGIATGHHGLSVTVEMIPQNETVRSDDMVITSGLESNIPRGLLIGTVASVTKEPSQPFQSARINMPYDLNKLTWVAILGK